MSGPGDTLQGFPQNAAPVVDPNTGYRWTQPWLQFMISLWRRTGTAQGGTSAPTGSGQQFLGPLSAIPAGWLYCDGSEVSRVDYAALFSIIGTYWGAGNGITTFNIPDLRNRILIGSGTLAYATRGGNIPLTGGAAGIGYAVINYIIKV